MDGVFGLLWWVPKGIIYNGLNATNCPNWPWRNLMGPDPVCWWSTEWDVHLVIIVAVTEVRRDPRRGSSSFASSPPLIEAASPSTSKLLVKAGIGEDRLGGCLLAAGPHLDRYLWLYLDLYVLPFEFAWFFVQGEFFHWSRPEKF